MKRFGKLFPASAVFAAFAAAPIHTTQPGQTVNPDGFSSGDHDNQNILGEKD
jgi:hypothetical protein